MGLEFYHGQDRVETECGVEERKGKEGEQHPGSGTPTHAVSDLAGGCQSVDSLPYRGGSCPSKRPKGVRKDVQNLWVSARKPDLGSFAKGTKEGRGDGRRHDWLEKVYVPATVDVESHAIWKKEKYVVRDIDE